MSTIDDLRESILSINQETLMEMMLSIRANRRVSKYKSKNKSKTKSPIVDLNKIALGLSPDAAQALLDAIEQKRSQK
tara:strand:+ start:5875 stop:6105 length:231 start_codon:yes stop_codon:yes gene_type:complete